MAVLGGKAKAISLNTMTCRVEVPITGPTKAKDMAMVERIIITTITIVTTIETKEAAIEAVEEEAEGDAIKQTP